LADASEVLRVEGRDADNRSTELGFPMNVSDYVFKWIAAENGTLHLKVLLFGFLWAAMTLLREGIF
jgi:hypothetical protein